MVGYKFDAKSEGISFQVGVEINLCFPFVVFSTSLRIKTLHHPFPLMKYNTKANSEFWSPAIKRFQGYQRKVNFSGSV